MTQREEKSGRTGLPVLAQGGAGDVVDDGDMVRIQGVTQAQPVGQGGGAQKKGVSVEQQKRQKPRQSVDPNQRSDQAQCSGTMGEILPCQELSPVSGTLMKRVS
ncbi:hypothetical protein [Gluconobacter potus]|uniref:hypothetical protein n=1 Tax=Gluconobacter potus TaxID=2724927 RepID=UPI0039E87791